MKENIVEAFQPINVTMAAFVAICFMGFIIWSVYVNTPKLLTDVKGISKMKLWRLMEPIIIRGYKEVNEILKDDDLTYEEVEKIVIIKVMALVRAAKFLTREQKDMMDEDMVRSWIRPSLKIFYKEITERKAQQKLK